MKKTRIILSILIISLFIFRCESKSDKSSEGSNPNFNSKDIISFIFTAELNSDLSEDIPGVIDNADITATVPYATDTSALIPTIVITGKSIAPPGGEPNAFPDGISVIYTVTAEDGSKKEYSVIVTIASFAEPTLLSIQISPNHPVITTGNTQQFTATGIYSDESQNDLTGLVEWSTTDNGIASIGNDPGTSGLVQSVTTGKVDITATYENYSDTTSIESVDGPVYYLPFEAAPVNPSEQIALSTDVAKVDIFFIMDSTGSMGDEIGELKSSINSIINSLAAVISDLAIGVGHYKDYPVSPYGSPGDIPFALLHRIMTVNTAEGINSITAAVNGLSAAGGNDYPESGWEALYQITTGLGDSYITPFDPLTALPVVIPDGEVVDEIGGAGFRDGSFPIVVWITDAYNHNSEGYPADNYGAITGANPAMRSEAIAEALALGIRVIGIAAQGGTDFAATSADLLEAVNSTDAIVSPNAWGPVGVRPAICSIMDCCTGIMGDGVPAVAGFCPLRLTTDALGTGLGDSSSDSLIALITSKEKDVSAAVIDDKSDSVDVGLFVEHIEVDQSGSPCTDSLTTIDNDGDTWDDTYLDVNPGTSVCFSVITKKNIIVPAGETPQVFKASLVAKGLCIEKYGTRDIYFVVPVDPGEPVEKSDDASMANLSVSSGTLIPAFSQEIQSYYVYVPNSVSELTVTPVANDPYASITIQGISVISGTPSQTINLAEGENNITLIITSENEENQNTYTITVKRASAAASSDAALSNLTISSGTLFPAFSSNTYSYTADVVWEVSSLEIIPVASDPNAIIEIQGEFVNSGSPSGPVNLNVGSNIINIIVTAEDILTQLTYTITVSREYEFISEGPLDLGSLPVNYDGEVDYLNPSFYWVNVTDGNSYTIELTGLSRNADLFIYSESEYSIQIGSSTNSGDTTDEIVVVTASGISILFIKVSSQNVTSPGTYFTLAVTDTTKSL
jgi:hypothetical protein